MTAITLELQDENDLELILILSNRINAKVTNLNKSNLKNTSPAIDILDKIAQKGGIHYIPDPSLWQDELRQDTALFGRE